MRILVGHPFSTVAIVGGFVACGAAMALLHGGVAPAVSALATGIGWIGSGAALSRSTAR